MCFNFDKLSPRRKAAVAYITIVIIIFVLWGILSLTHGFSQDLRDALLVFLGATLGNLVWEVVKKGF